MSKRTVVCGFFIYLISCQVIAAPVDCCASDHEMTSQVLNNRVIGDAGIMKPSEMQDRSTNHFQGYLPPPSLQYRMYEEPRAMMPFPLPDIFTNPALPPKIVPTEPEAETAP